jgi:hypothetical protein
MPQIKFKTPPDVRDIPAFNECFLFMFNTMFGIGAGTTGNQDSQNVDFTEPEDRANHTGTQDSSTISDFDESVDDRVNDLLVAGNALTNTYNDGANTLTQDVTAAENPGDLTIVTTESATGAYGTNERDMLNNLKTDVTNIIAKANLLLDKLIAAELMEA